MLDEKENNIELKHFLKDLDLITYFARKNLFKEIFTLNDIKKLINLERNQIILLIIIYLPKYY